MSSLPQTASKDEIEGDIVFNTVLLTTLDPDDDDFEQRKAEYEAALADLDGRLAALRTPVSSSRPETPNSQTAGALSAAAASGRSYDLPSREQRTSKSNLPPQSPLGSYSNWGWPADNGPADLSAAAASGASTPSSTTSNVSKRPRDSLHAFSTHKRPRHSNDVTAASPVGTSASFDSIERDDELAEKKYGIKNLTSSRANIMKKMQEQEKQRLARLKAEREDQEMAMLLSSQSGYQPPSIPASTAQSYFYPNGQWRKPQQSRPMPSPSLQQPPVPQRRIKPESPAPNSEARVAPTQNHTGFLPSSQLLQQQARSNAVPNPINLYDDDDDDEDDDDSDLQIISHDQFHLNTGGSNRSRATNSLYSSMGQSHGAPSVQYPQRYEGSNFGLPNYNGMNYAGPSRLPNAMAGGSNVYGNHVPTSWTSATANGIRQGGAAIWGGLSSAVGMLTGDFSVDLRDDDDGWRFSSAIAPAVPTFEENMTARGYNYMLADPTKTREDLEALLENIRPDEEIPPELRIGSPQELRVPLMEHQKLGLAWLQAQEAGSNKGAILADDMGLGKTIQALALIATRPSEDPACKTTLIIAPVSLMRQWKKEIEEKMSPRHKLSVYVMHGKQKKASFAMLSTHDVVITTFGTVAAELTRKLRFEERLRTDPNATRRRDEETVLLRDGRKWYRIIIDEAQMIKNKDTKAAMACLHLNAEYRLCMTGTPMMNNVGELYSLIRFLRIPPYNDLQRFNRDFKKPIESRYENDRERGMKLLQGLLKAILLRRTKKSEIDGRPILQLPERTTEIIHAVFDEDQENFYRSIEHQATIQVSRYLEAGKIGRNYSYILVRLLRLRQACCHPHLIRDFAQDGPGDVSEDEMRELVKSLSDEVVARIKDTDGQFECPICYDAVGNPTIFFPCGHDCCPECFTRITDPSLAVAQGNENVDAKCPECRNKLDVKKVFDFKAFKKVHMPDGGTEEDELPKVGNDESDSDTDSDEDSEDSDDADSQGDLRDFIVSDNESVDEETDDEEAEASNKEAKEEEESDFEIPRANKSSNIKKKAKKGPRKSKNAKGKGKKQDKTKKLAELRKEGLRNASAKRKYLRRLRKNWVTSAKVEKTMEILRGIHENDPSEKTIIFSQFTSFLDLLEVPIDGDGWNYRRYDGSMSAKLRNAAVEDFHDQRNVKIMLVSLKAGNAGLNLTAASQVIILDPFWNPFIEEQAIDRAHRIGQNRPVQVHRVLVQDTVEDRIIALQEKKREMINEALDEKAGQSVSRLGRRELRYLFGISDRL